MTEDLGPGPDAHPGTILAAGDGFVLTGLFRDALRAELGEELGEGLGGATGLRELSLPWPRVPFGPVAEVDEASGDEEQIVEALTGVTVAVTHLAPFTAAVFDNAPDLQLVVVSRGGPVNVNLDAATGHGVAVCYAPGRNANAAAEFTLGLTVAACRNLASGHVGMVGGDWPGHFYEYGSAGTEIEGSTVGLVGYGAIGRRVARLFAAFGARVLVHDPYVTEVEPDVTLVPVLDDLLAASRILSLHSRATPGNRNMIGAREIALMPEGSVLVNTARGSLLDQDALCDALDSGHLGAAGLDVYAVEPPQPDSRLRRTRNLVLAPHISGCSRQVAERAARICAAEVGRWARRQPLAHCANPAVLKAGLRAGGRTNGGPGE